MDNKKLNKEVQNIENTEIMNNNSSDTTIEDKKDQQILENSQSEVHLENNTSQNNKKQKIRIKQCTLAWISTLAICNLLL